MGAGVLSVIQALGLGFAITLVDLTQYQSATKWLAIGVLAWWALLAASYLTTRLRNERRRVGRGRAEVLVALTSIAAAAVPLIYGSAEDPQPGGGKPVAVGVLAVAALLITMFASYLVDWYYVLPRRDGLVGDPPCRTTKGWTGLTRVWYTHRALAGIIGSIAVVVATTAFAFSAFSMPTGPDASSKTASLLLASAASGLTLTRLLYGNLTTLGSVFSTCCLSPPNIALGDRLVGPEGFCGGYVRDVSLEGISVIRLDEEGNPEDGIHRLKRHGIAHVLDQPDIEGVPFAPCKATCQMINDKCLWRGPSPPGS